MAEEVNYKPALTKFPSEGVCFNHNQELFDYLMDRDVMRNSKIEYEPHMKGLAWTAASLWFVSVSSSKPQYTMEQLYPFIPHIIRKADMEVKGYCVCPHASVHTTEEIKEYFGKLLNRKVSGGGSEYYHYPEFRTNKCSSTKIEPGYKMISFPEFARLHPLTPEECFPPDKWCIKITPENNAALMEFLLERSDEYKGCRPPEQWSLTNGFFFFYPQPTTGCHSADGPRPEWGHTLIGNIELVHIFANLRKEVAVPEKWAVLITDQNQEQLKVFLDNNKEKWKGYMPSWYPIAKDYFTYPQHVDNCFASRGAVPKGYTLVPFDKIKHVLTDKQTISTNTLTLKQDGTRRNTIEVQGPTLTISRGGTIRAVGLRCSDSEITVRSGHSPNKTGPIKG